MKKAIYLLLIINTVAVQAQTIKGWVFSAKDKTPVEYATVSLLHLPDSSVVKGVSTQATGEFLIDDLKTGKYYLRVTSLGLQTKGKIVVLKPDLKSVSVDTVLMTDASKQIAEVVVTGEKIKGKELVDRTVYAIPSNIAKSSVNGYEVLQKIPSIQVDFNDNVTLNGSTNFIIQVDGKIRDKDFLAKLLPTDIESVEVISNPSGKYEGTVDGVINIILKKEARYGVSGDITVRMRAYKEGSGNINGSLDYGLGKLRLYFTGKSWDQNLSVFSKGIYNYSMGLDNLVMDGSGDGQYHLSANSINTGFDYYLNNKNTLNFNFNVKPYKQDIYVDNQGTQQTIENGIDTIQNSILKNPTTNNVSSQEYNVTLFYKKQYSKPIQELTAEIRYYYYHAITDNLYPRIYFAQNNLQTPVDSVIDNEKNIDERYAWTGKIDYVYPIGISARIETGYQFYFQELNYNYSRNAIADTPFLYSEVRNAAYAGIIWNYKKFGFQAMGRAENSIININNTSSNSYLCFLPSANLQYKYTGTQNIKLTFNRRIVRPGIGDLYPFLKSSGLVFTQGNPYLKPEYDDKIQLTYTANIGKNYIAPNIYYTMISNKIGQLNQLENVTLFNGAMNEVKQENVAVSKNVLNGYEQGIGLNAMLWFFNINARVFQGHYNAIYYTTGSIVNRIPFTKYSSFALNSYMYGELFYKINAFGFINYNGESVNAQSKTTSTAFYGFGLQRTFGSHTFQFFYLLPLSKDITMGRTVTNSPGFYSNTSYGFDASYYFQLGYTYKFNKGRTVKKIVHEEESESDTKTQGLGR